MKSALQTYNRFAAFLINLPIPWTNHYGLARTILASGTLLTLLFNSHEILFIRAIETPIACTQFSNFTLFCLMPESQLTIAKWLAIIALVVVVSGWRPRFTGIIHWYIAYSCHTTFIVVDGGDQITNVLTLFLIPITLMDGRQWHWSPPKIKGQVTTTLNVYQKIISWTSIYMIKLQVAIVYFNSAVAKFWVQEWFDGTALYYWMSGNYMGLPNYLKPIIGPLTTNGNTLALITWGALILELMIAATLVMRGCNTILLQMGFNRLGRK